MELVRDRDYFVCQYCNSFHFPTPSKEGVRSLGQTSGVTCPACQRELELASVKGRRILHCPNCQGLLTKRPTFLRIVRERRNEAEVPPDPPRPLNRAELDRTLICPFCDRVMDTHPYYGPGNVVLDSCAHCGVIWLDFGELGIIVNAPGADRQWRLEWG
jgi:Zn-finger nucleic acid-binding protein